MTTITETDLAGEKSRRSRQRPGDLRLMGSLALLALLAGLGVYFVFSFANAERERDLRAWQDRMGIIAESRLAAVNGWLDDQFDHLQALSDNTALKLYMTELALGDGDVGAVTDESAQRGYLRNLLIAAAERAGFTGQVLGPDVPANVERIGVSGIAIVTNDGRVLVTTPAMPPLDQRLHASVTETPRGERALIDIFSGPAGDPVIGFVTPIFMVQSEGGPSEQIGHIVGIKEVTGSLYPLLLQPGATVASGEALLVRQVDAAVEYISPQADGTVALKRKLAADTPDLAAGFALSRSGGFGILNDYAGTEVLVTARAVAGAPWSLLYKVDRDEALAASDTRRSRLVITFLLIIGLISAALVAVWFQASSRNANLVARRYRDLAGQYGRQQNFLRLVTDSQPNEIAIIDHDGRVRFGNRRLAEVTGTSSIDMAGKSVGAVFGPAAAKRIATANARALEAGETVIDIDRAGEDEALRITQSQYIPLPADADSVGGAGAVLLVAEDITEAVREREQRERIMRDLVRTLVGVIDKRDPFAAHHSRRVAEVARAVAEEMSLEPVEAETAEIAASVMNLGKILVPENVLTAERELTEEERTQIQNSILDSADLLQGVAFGGPVVETMRQLLEHIDGSGRPKGLTGNEILKTAQVCAVANAFVGMVSRRAYRQGMDFDKAIDILLDEAGHRYDRGVVVALINYLDNHGGRARWEYFRSEEGPAPT